MLEYSSCLVKDSQLRNGAKIAWFYLGKWNGLSAVRCFLHA